MKHGIEERRKRWMQATDTALGTMEGSIRKSLHNCNSDDYRRADETYSASQTQWELVGVPPVKIMLYKARYAEIQNKISQGLIPHKIRDPLSEMAMAGAQA